MGLACREGEGAENGEVGAAIAHMIEVLEGQGEHLSLIPVVDMRCHHMKAQPRWAGSQAELGARRRMVACRRERGWCEYMYPSDEE